METDILENYDYEEYTDDEGRACRKCKCCGHIERKYVERLSKVAIIALKEIMALGGIGTSRDMDLNRYSALQQQTIRSNLQKLQYFGLLEKAEKRNWQVTELGEAFLNGVATCPSVVTRYGDNVIAEDEPVYISKYYDLDYVEDKDYYEDQARINYKELI